MNNTRTPGIIILVLLALLAGTNLYHMSAKKQLTRDNRTLTSENKMLKEEMKQKKLPTTEEKVVDNESDAEAENIDDLKSFSEEFVNHLNVTGDFEKNNEYLKSVTEEDAQNYLKSNHYIFESNITTEAKTDSHEHQEGYDTEKVDITTNNIKSFFNKINDKTYEGVTTYQVATTIKGDTTIGNFIMKASYVFDGTQWKVSRVNTISQVTDQKAETIFEN